MKHTMITPKDAVIIPVGFTAPAWTAQVNTYLGVLITILTFFYVLFKAVDAYYQWRHRWEIRKTQKKGETS